MQNVTLIRVIEEFFDLLDRRGIASFRNGGYAPRPHAQRIVEEFNILFRVGHWKPDQIQQLARCVEALWIQSKETIQGELF